MATKRKGGSGPAAGQGGKAPGAARPATADPVQGVISLEELKRIPAFSGLSDTDAKIFLGLMTEKPVARGEPIFREGELGEGLFVILQGSVSITKKNQKGGEREVAVLQKSEVFGEMDLVSDRPHTSGAKGAESSTLLSLPRSDFQKLLLGGNKGALSMVLYFTRMLAGRLDANNKRMMEILDDKKKPAQSEFADFKRRLLREWTF